MTNEVKHRLLVANDEAVQVRALCDGLTALGHETVGCTRASEALARLLGTRFDVLLIDLMMPDMDGIALLCAARVSDPPLIGVVMTSEDMIATAVQAMQVGALNYVPKPAKLGALRPVLMRMIAMHQLRVENAALEEGQRTRTAQFKAKLRDLEANACSGSHDLRGPLRRIDGLTKSLERLPPDRVLAKPPTPAEVRGALAKTFHSSG